MELQIQDLITSIKKEGIDSAKKEADKIIKDANKKADSIIAQAKAEAAKTFEDCKKEIEILKQSANVSAQQAKRDAVISFKQEINEHLNRILTSDIGKVMNDEVLAQLIKSVIADSDTSKITVEVGNVSDSLKNELAVEIKNGLEIRPVKSVKAGFRVVMKDGSGFMDCTDEQIAEMLKPFLGQINF